MTEDRNFVTALARGLDILRCFDSPGIELSVSEIARQAKLNQPTAWRLCHTLVECGYLVRTMGSALRIGAPALSLGYAAIEGMSFPAIALSYMQQLTAQTKGTTSLALRQSIEIISVQQCNGAFVLPNQPVGWRTLLTTSPSGLAVLVALPQAEQNAAFAKLEASDPKAWPLRSLRIAEAAAQYAAFGYVIRQGMLGGQYASVAVPVIAAAGGQSTAWGLSCGGVSSRWGAEELEKAGHELRRSKALLEPALAAIYNAEIRGASDHQSGMR